MQPRDDVAATIEQRMVEQVDRLSETLIERNAEILRLRKLIGAYVVSVSRAPNNRDEAEIEAATRALVGEVIRRD